MHRLSALMTVAAALLLPAVSQALTVVGNISDFNSVGAYYLTLRSDSDSIAGTFDTERFYVDIPAADKIQLDIKSTGRQDWHGTLDASKATGDTLYVGNIELQESAVGLNEVTVTAKRAKITRDGRNYTLSNLQGTHIGEAGTVYEMLGWTPGIVTYSLDDIRVNGRLQVDAIYIDERKISDRNLLMSLPSSQVAKIEVIRDGGVKYSAETGAVIKITLKKQLKDYVGLSITDNLRINRRVSDDGWINLSAKSGKVSYFASFVEQYMSSKANMDGGTSVSDESGLRYSDTSHSDYTSKKTGPVWTLGLTWQARPSLAFMAQYTGESTTTDFDETQLHRLVKTGTESLITETTSIPERRAKRNNITTGMSYNSPKGHSLNLTVSYSKKDNREDRDIANYVNDASTPLAERTIGINNKYDLVDAELNWSFPLKGSKMEVGYNVGAIKNVYDYTDNGLSQQTRRNDYTNALFAQWRRGWGKFNLNLGTRFMLNNTKLTYSGTEETDNTFRFRPYVRLDYNINDDYSIGGTYTQYISYPSISQLNPAVVYEDTIHYTRGNAALDNTVDHSLSFYANLRDFSIMIDYDHIKSMIVRGIAQYNDISIIETPINSRYCRKFEFDVSWSGQFGNFSIDPDIDYTYYSLKMPETGEVVIKNLKEHNLYASCDLSYSFWKTAEIYSEVYYQSPWYDSNKRIGRTLGINVGIKKTFLDGRLFVKLEGHDLAGQGVTPRWDLDFGNISEWHRNHYDTRGVRLTLRYTFNSLRTGYRNARIYKTTDERAD